MLRYWKDVSICPGYSVCFLVCVLFYVTNSNIAGLLNWVDNLNNKPKYVPLLAQASSRNGKAWTVIPTQAHTGPGFETSHTSYFCKHYDLCLRIKLGILINSEPTGSNPRHSAWKVKQLLYRGLLIFLSLRMFLINFKIVGAHKIASYGWNLTFLAYCS